MTTQQIDLQRNRPQNHPEQNGECHRLPPNDFQIECDLLGCILYPSTEALAESMNRITTPETFYDLRTRVVWETIVEMSQDDMPVDVTTVSARLRAFGQIHALGGETFVSGLPDNSIPSNTGYLIDRLLEHYQKRGILQLCTDFIGRVYEHHGDITELLDSFESEALKVRIHEGQTVSANCGETVREAIDLIEHYHQQSGLLTGLSTGFPDLDKMLCGLHGGEMIVIAGRPSMGKSAIALNIAENVTIEQQMPVCVYSLEMTKLSLVLRAICSRSRVNIRNIREGFLAERDFPKLAAAASRLHKAPLFIDDQPGLTITQLRARARKMVQQFGIQLFIVDHFQCMQIAVKRGETRQSAFADVSNGLKLMARELNVPVIVLSQLSRELERDGNRKPRLSDLKETGALEQDADVAGFLYRPRVKDDDDQEQDAIPVNLLIAKQRNGPCGDIHLTFVKPYTRFESAARVSGEDILDPQVSLPYKG